MNALADQPAINPDLTVDAMDNDADTASNDPDMAILYDNALKAKRLARLKHLQMVARLVQQAQQALQLAIDKSLVEREQERIEADSASPEASPAPIPFSLSRPEAYASNDATPSVDNNVVSTASDALASLVPDRVTPAIIESDVVATVSSLSNIESNNAGLAPTPEPSTWALFGVGASLMLFVFPKRTAKLATAPQKKN